MLKIMIKVEEDNLEQSNKNLNDENLINDHDIVLDDRD